MSTRCLLCWPFWQFRRLYRKRRHRRLSSSLFLRASVTTLTDDVFDFTVHCSPMLKEAPHGEGSEQTMPLLLRILRIQLGIRQQQREVLQEVRQLKHKVRLLSVPQHAQPAKRPSDLPRLPAGTIGEVEAAEAAVQSKAVAAALRKHLLQIGGRGLRKIGVNAMKAVLAHDVQVLYSLHGRKGKRAFVNLRLCRLVTDVICQKAGCDQAEALNFIKSWLPRSGDRCGGRKRRFREEFVVEQPDDPHSQSADYRLLAAAGFLPSHSSQGLDSTTVTVPPTQPDLQ
ncbi:uncharacterized protein LOC142814788 isoform X1 [Rhipicephalus microplus]|uniref:uncharacterized protein LOC142814787 isoform X1 n=2 Tax=Rhipicephalus microplus TaxID=6941 RepID=UPI003F6BFC93